MTQPAAADPVSLLEAVAILGGSSYLGICQCLQAVKDAATVHMLFRAHRMVCISVHWVLVPVRITVIADTYVYMH